MHLNQRAAHDPAQNATDSRFANTNLHTGIVKDHHTIGDEIYRDRVLLSLLHRSNVPPICLIRGTGWLDSSGDAYQWRAAFSHLEAIIQSVRPQQQARR